MGFVVGLEGGTGGLQALLAVRRGDDFAQIRQNVAVVAADDAVDAKVERLRLVHLKQLTHQGDKAVFRLALDRCFHGLTDAIDGAAFAARARLLHRQPAPV